MRKLLSALIVVLALVAHVAGGSNTALAWDRRHPHGGGTAVTVVPPKPFVHHGVPRGHVHPHPVGPVWPRPFFFHRPFAPFVIYPSPTYLYTPVYAPPQVVYVQPQPVFAAPQPAAPSVIQYPTGRYELRGDGITTPYTWVWVPNPPAPPEAPPDPLMEGAPDPAPSAEQAPRVPSELYHWVDDEGVRYWTDRLDRVPERYRPDARSRQLPEVGS